MKTTALRARILNDEVEANATSASPPTTAKIEQVLQKYSDHDEKKGKRKSLTTTITTTTTTTTTRFLRFLP